MNIDRNLKLQESNSRFMSVVFFIVVSVVVVVVVFNFVFFVVNVTVVDVFVVVVVVFLHLSSLLFLSWLSVLIKKFELIKNVA